jgi:hypothetical protein
VETKNPRRYRKTISQTAHVVQGDFVQMYNPGLFGGVRGGFASVRLTCHICII